MRIDAPRSRGRRAVALACAAAMAASPKEIVARLRAELVRVLQSPGASARLEQAGADVIGNTSAEAGALARSDIDRWAEVVRRAGVTVTSPRQEHPA